MWSHAYRRNLQCTTQAIFHRCKKDSTRGVVAVAASYLHSCFIVVKFTTTSFAYMANFCGVTTNEHEPWLIWHQLILHF